MGYFVQYSLELQISKQNKERALEIFNHLHSDEMLLKHARGGSYGNHTYEKPVVEYKWYSWVENPVTPYQNLNQAFDNWGITDEADTTMEEDSKGNFCLCGGYDNKLGQQDFLLSQLAPILKNTVIYVRGEDNEVVFAWIIENGEFRDESLTIYAKDDEEKEEDKDDEETYDE